MNIIVVDCRICDVLSSNIPNTWELSILNANQELELWSHTGFVMNLYDSSVVGHYLPKGIYSRVFKYLYDLEYI